LDDVVKRIELKLVGDIAIVYPKGMFTGGSETEAFHDALFAAFERGAGRLVVNLKDTAFLNSVALGVLIAAHVHYVRRGGRICLCCLPTRVWRVLETVPCGIVLDTYETEDEAVASFRDWKPPEVSKATTATQ
jgi:anti-sigma B factor antagonist